MPMVFIETPIFTRALRETLSDEEYSTLQLRLIVDPEAGDLIPGSGGLRKIRVSSGGKGKRGGARVIYFLHPASQQCFLLLIYKKSALENPSLGQLKKIRTAIMQSFYE